MLPTSLAKAFALGLSATLAMISTANAAEDSGRSVTGPRLIFPAGTVTTTNNAIQMMRVPVVLGNGTVVYRDMRIEFVVAPTGAITIRPGFPQIAASPTILTANFIAGRYKLTTNNQIFILSRGNILIGGRTNWTINGAAENTVSDCKIFNAYFTTGAIAGHPTLANRLANARITNANLSYGLVSSRTTASSLSDVCMTDFKQYTLMGVEPTADGLIVHSFTGVQDKSEPLTSYFLRRCPSTGQCE